MRLKFLGDDTEFAGVTFPAGRQSARIALEWGCEAFAELAGQPPCFAYVSPDARCSTMPGMKIVRHSRVPAGAIVLGVRAWEL